MKYIKMFEEVDNGWIINITDIIKSDIFKKIDDISNSVKEGDIVIGVWFNGGYETYLLKFEKNDDGDLGTSDDEYAYMIEYAWGIFSVEDYKKYDPDFELKLHTRKYNL